VAQFLTVVWQPWLLAHRVHLHDALKKKATCTEGPGSPAELHTSSRVVDVDVAATTVILENGQIVQSDLVIGADGVHSAARKKVSGKDVKPHGSGKSAFRFLLSRKSAQDDPITSKFVQKPGELIIWYAADRRVVVYPTTNNQLLNFVCIHPESESEGGGDSWNTTGHQDQLLRIYKEFNPAMLALLNKADTNSLKVWKLLDMEVLPTWVNEKLALLGDAAHPFLPHQGQGGGCAIEDAAALAVVLPADTPRDEITARLQLYENIRIQRANRIQEYSRLAGADSTEDIKLDSIASFQLICYASSTNDVSVCIHQLQFWSRRVG
jgi:2-polyprenyl-6-methoxyphenol hydroxylase-like FAD-dependent oxidoreductase